MSVRTRDGDVVRMYMAHFTPHAKRRRKQMKVTEAEVELAISDPELTYPSERAGVPRRLFQRGRIVVVTDWDGTEVVTVLWHRKEGRDGS